jgi:ureidoacrylate peracid hydrolase
LPSVDTPSLLLLIDLQRAFCDEDGSVALQGRNVSPLRRAAEQCAALARQARAAGVPVVWTRMMFRPDYADGGTILAMRPNLARIGALRAGTPDVELSAAAGAEATDIVIDKPRYSALYATPLEAMLRAFGTRRILLGGVTTSMCVETTARDLAQRDYDLQVVAEACGDFDPARHEASLAALAFGFAPVVPLTQAAALLREE